MKKLILLCIGLLPILCLAQTDCTLEEYALLQDKPSSITNTQALSLIQGSENFITLDFGENDVFENIQTFPYPMDIQRTYSDIVLLEKVGNKRTWKEKESGILSYINPDELNRGLITIWILFFVVYVFRVIYSPVDLWEYDGLIDLLMKFAGVAIVSLICNFVIYVAVEAIQDYKNFYFTDYLLRCLAMFIIGAGTILIGNLLRWLYYFFKKNQKHVITT